MYMYSSYCWPTIFREGKLLPVASWQTGDLIVIIACSESTYMYAYNHAPYHSKLVIKNSNPIQCTCSIRNSMFKCHRVIINRIE